MRESHLGIQHGKCDRSLWSEISVQHTALFKECEGNQRVTQGEKHMRLSSCGARCQQHDDDWSVLRLSRHGKQKDQQSLVYEACPQANWWQLSGFFVLKSFVKSVVTVQSAINVKYIWRVKGHGRKKKLLFPNGKSKERICFVPACLIDFS